MAGKPFDQLNGDIWYDGIFVPWTDAKLHVLSHGLHYGSSVFEGERAYGGRIFKSEDTRNGCWLPRANWVLKFPGPPNRSMLRKKKLWRA